MYFSLPPACLSRLLLRLCCYLVVAVIRQKILLDQICLYQNRKGDSSFFSSPFDTQKAFGFSPWLSVTSATEISAGNGEYFQDTCMITAPLK